MKYGKKIPTNIVIIIIAVVIVALIGYFNEWSRSVTPRPVTRSASQPQPSSSDTLPAAIEAESVSWKSWRTGKGHFVLQVPSDWDVTQADAGGLSMVLFSSPNHVDINPNLTISLASAADFEGSGVTPFFSWVRDGGKKYARTRPTILSSKELTLGGLSVVSQVEDGSTMAYYADLGGGVYLKAGYDLGDAQKNTLETIVSTIHFRPTEAQLQGAEIIP